MSAPRGPVLVNARAASRPELGGVERLTRELAARLPARRPGAYRVVRPPAILSHRAGHAWEQALLPAWAATRRAPLIFSPAHLAPLAWPRNVVLISDAAALRCPGWYSRSYARWQRLAMPALARRALAVITVSSFSRGELVSLLGADPARITVIPLGVGERFSPSADPEPARRALDLPGPYVLTVGSRIARKNLGALGRAARELDRDGLELVAAGGYRPQFRPGGAGGEVRFLGPVPDELLPGLYAGARAFVLPSLYEGFGLPCLEAMAAGVPVVAAAAGALPETCGDAALLVDPHDEEGFAAALGRAVADEELRGSLTAAGRRRAGTLTWERTAGAVDALLTGLAVPAPARGSVERFQRERIFEQADGALSEAKRDG